MKAVALFSGGLDSILAVKIAQREGVEVIALHLLMPFCRYDSKKEFLLKKTADDLKAELKIAAVKEDYLDILVNPQFGYGKNFNPCIDCRIFMLKSAYKIMREMGASFIVTGEVLGQRLMSQTKRALNMIDKESGLQGLILRPLSAKLFSVTIPEEKGWVKRDNLFDISGKRRVFQIELADKLGIEVYPWPGGGCLLTERQFVNRVKDAMVYGRLNLEEAELLKVGRHIRLTPEYKLVVGKNQDDNKRILSLVKTNDLYFEPLELPGPSGLGRGGFSEEVKRLSARIIARYTSPYAKEVKIRMRSSSGIEEVILADSISEERLRELRI